LFGPIPAGETAIPITAAEPPQTEKRRVTVTGADSTPHLIYAYKAPPANHPDYLPLSLLNAAFTGGSSLGMFGGGGSNKSSRLYRALVSTELAVSVHGGLTPSVDPFLYMINVTARNGRSLTEVEAALENEINRLAAEPITQAELDKALKRAKAGFVMAGESITGQTQLLGLAETVVGDYGWFETVLERLNQVTLADIERVRQTYLQPAQRTVGVYRKDEG
ncbi:MAG: M16 family metallopeptidase, partial [Anaerolineae bacterium]